MGRTIAVVVNSNGTKRRSVVTRTERRNDG